MGKTFTIFAGIVDSARLQIPGSGLIEIYQWSEQEEEVHMRKYKRPGSVLCGGFGHDLSIRFSFWYTSFYT